MDAPHLPRQALIEAHGGGGFRFAGLSHRGSLLCLPDGIWAWPVTAPAAITEAALALVFARADDLDFFVVGTGDATKRIRTGDRVRVDGDRGTVRVLS